MVSLAAAAVVMYVLMPAIDSGAYERRSRPVDSLGSMGHGSRQQEVIRLLSVLSPSSREIRRGKQLYDSHCASCHGAEGYGNGPSGSVLVRAPRNFHDTTGWISRRAISDLFHILDDGIIPSGMPAYNHLSAADLFAILAYLRTLSGNFPAATETEVRSVSSQYRITILEK